MLARCFFACVFDAAKVDAGTAACFLGGDASGEIGCDGVVEVEAEFVIEVAGTAALEEEAEACECFSDHRSADHDFASCGLRPSTSATAVERRSQVASSASSCLLPARVSA
ncbi:MAG: hypothetical protein QOK38_2885 [Acidobacteriaceae bacterium]|nr:hypothetical protein [Acidobacteriaceae bacterium]